MGGSDRDWKEGTGVGAQTEWQWARPTQRNARPSSASLIGRISKSVLLIFVVLAGLPLLAAPESSALSWRSILSAIPRTARTAQELSPIDRPSTLASARRSAMCFLKNTACSLGQEDPAAPLLAGRAATYSESLAARHSASARR